jgi:hypothetical protein
MYLKILLRNRIQLIALIRTIQLVVRIIGVKIVFLYSLLDDAFHLDYDFIHRNTCQVSFCTYFLITEREVMSCFARVNALCKAASLSPDEIFRPLIDKNIHKVQAKRKRFLCICESNYLIGQITSTEYPLS